MSDDAAWVKSLQPGDYVAVRDRWQPSYTIYQVHAVTPSGRIRVRVGESAVWEFGTNGWLRGQGPWDQSRIEPVTQAVKDANRRVHLRERIGKTDWSRVPLPVLEKVVALLTTPSPRPGGGGE